MSVDLTQSIGQNVQAAQQYSATALENKVKNADLKDAKEDELLEVCKNFESYFIEQVIKEVEKTVKTDESGSYASQMTDYFKDSVIQDVAGKITDQSGATLAQKLYEQMKRNYGISDRTAEEEGSEDVTAAAERTAGAAMEQKEPAAVSVSE